MDGTQFEIGDFQIIEFRGTQKNQPNGKEYKFTFMLHVACLVQQQLSEAE